MSSPLRLPLRLLFTSFIIGACAVIATPAMAQQKKKNEPQESPYQTLVSTDGQKIEVEILGVDGPNVRVVRSDGQDFRFPLSMLDKKSQELVREWALDSALANDVKIQVRERTAKKESVPSNTSSGEIKHNFLQFNITNGSNVPVDKLRIEYRIFLTEERIGRPNKDFAQEIVLPGKIDLGTIPAGQQKSFDSEVVRLLEEKLNSNVIPAVGKNRTSKDKIDGYWFRLYRGKNMITQESTPRRLMNVKTW